MLRDTHKTYEELTGAGGDPTFVRALLRTLQEGDEDLVTKEDLRREAQSLRQEIQHVHQDLHKEIQNVRKDLDQEIQHVRKDLHQESQHVRKDVHQEVEILRRDTNTQHEELKGVIWQAATAVIGITLAALGIATALIIAYT